MFSTFRLIIMLRLQLRDVTATTGWAVVLASVVLQALYVRASLTEFEIVLLFFGSVVVGAVLADLERLILSCVAAIALSVVIMYICLNLPAILHLATAAEALGEGAIVMVFRGIFPIPIIAILFGGLLGSYIGERLQFR